MMSLGTLGQYGSDSSLSDTDEDEAGSIRVEKGDDTSPPISHAADLLGLHCDTAESEGTSGSEEDSSPSSPSPVSGPATTSCLPLPNIDRIVAKNASYASSVLVAKLEDDGRKPVAADDVDSGKGEHSKESSVFSNPYKQAEEARLAILKQHVSQFDKKPEVRGGDASVPTPPTFGSHRRRRGGASGVSIPPPPNYRPHKRVQGSAKGGGNMFIPPPSTFGFHKRVHGSGDHSSYTEETSGGSNSDLFDEHDSSLHVAKKHKHRSGVTDSLMPPKKFMKMYEKIQAEERPWTCN